MHAFVLEIISERIYPTSLQLSLMNIIYLTIFCVCVCVCVCMCMSVCFEVISEYSHPTSVISLKFPFMTIQCLTMFCACVCSQTLLDDVQRQLQNKEKMLQRLTRSLQEKDKQLRDVMDLTKDEVSSSYQLRCHPG